MNYVSNLVNVVCGNNGQVDTFIKKVMRSQEISNTERRNQILGNYGSVSPGKNGHAIGPRYVQTDKDDGTTWLVEKLDNGNTVPLNNNPLYPPNMIDRLNTPFDHIERILLQDFSNSDRENATEKLMDLDGENYFKSLFSFVYRSTGATASDAGDKYKDTYGVKKITVSDQNYPSTFTSADFSKVNNLFSNGEFFIDSFTYTPFIDYSLTGEGGDSKVGIYSDEFLTDYNCGRYEESYMGIGRKAQVDQNRHTLSSNLYQLRNLEKDLDEAKILFRDAIDRDNSLAETDGKVYIYTFCKHLATLFAKLSNIRMSHIIYGFKFPHYEWEGIIALDIWYNLLYRQIDDKYPFDETCLNMNPMSRHKVQTSGERKFIQYGSGNYYLDGSAPANHEWADVDQNGHAVPDEHGYVLLWDSSLWEKYRDNSKNIARTRKECVTPRGVLAKICQIIDDGVPESDVSYADSEGEFPWFYQRGKVYSDKNKSVYSKYTNLHIGAAYERMKPKEYCELMGVSPSSGKYQKPDFKTLDSAKRKEVVAAMVSGGCKALQDAFWVIKDEHLSNVFNSTTNAVEEFQSDYRDDYSQSQCAIAIERIFSRLYKYLNFKSTTGEVIQKHINIDSGYKYLTTDTILGSENSSVGGTNALAYYDENDDVPYLRYLTKLKKYHQSGTYSGNGLLTKSENAVLGHFIDILTKQARNWIQYKWNLCPLITSARSIAAKSMRSSLLSSRVVVEGSDDEFTGRVAVDMNLTPYMTWESGSISIPSGATLSLDVSNRPNLIEYTTNNTAFKFELSQITMSRKPRYTDEITVDYELLGYSTDRYAKTPSFSKTASISISDLRSDASSITLYAVWKTSYIVKFNHGNSPTPSAAQKMNPIVVSGGDQITLPMCTYPGPADTEYMFKYHDSPLDPEGSGSRIWQNVSSSDSVKVYRFSHWKYSVGGASGTIGDGGKFRVGDSLGAVRPVINMVAEWAIAYDSITFKVMGEDYCDVLIDRDINRVVYPKQDSKILISGKRFLGWDSLEGDLISGINRNAMVICGSAVSPLICSTKVGGVDSVPNDPIICQEAGLSSYLGSVSAYIVDMSSQTFDLTFKYVDASGTMQTKTQKVLQNSHVPAFHIHIEYASGSSRRVFRYWRLESGNISSQMTVLSSSVLVAVYDDIATPNVAQQANVETDQVVLIGKTSVGVIHQLSDCDYLCTGPKGSICAWCGTSPLDAGKGIQYNRYTQNGMSVLKPVSKTSSSIPDNVTPVTFSCPFYDMIDRLKSSTDDFDVLTMIEIEDVANLIKALLKVNMDIAHSEYYLKVDIPTFKQNGTSEEYGWWYGWKDGTKWISFEPTVEFKFSNFHAANQVENDRLICTVKSPNDGTNPTGIWITPINKELLTDASGNGKHFNDVWYYYDYKKSLTGVWGVKSQNTGATIQNLSVDNLTDEQSYYAVKPLYLYENTNVQSPTDVNNFVRHKYKYNYPIPRSRKQIRTFTSIVKKYRPVIMPDVKTIFNDPVNTNTKYEADINNDYGIFGWCTIPSKTMVNMEYNEQSIIVPSSYDHHNRIGGNNFLQMDKDFDYIYKKWEGTKETGGLIQNIKNTWYYLYNTRDWTYFLLPFFNVKQNSELYSYMLDTYRESLRPENSNHINGVIFEPSNLGRADDPTFGGIADTCEFLAKYHHNENNLKIVADRYTKMISYQKLKELTTSGDSGEFNSTYGSKYDGIPSSFRFPFQDWIDDYDKTGSYVWLTKGKYDPNSTSAELKYKYNLGQAHAIDDFDEDSVWFYITMVSPLEDLNQVIEIEDIMPFVFWWENRGKENNGPTVDCYGLQSNAKLNYEQGGWCYSGAHERVDEIINLVDGNLVSSPGDLIVEQKWHAVQHTLGTDFSKKDYGGTILTTDNSGNVYKGAFDPYCAGTDEKWKVHHMSNAFGTNQHEDPVEDKYHLGYKTHGDGEYKNSTISSGYNNGIVGLGSSLQDRPMTWNLWNVIRHYAYIKYFKAKNRELGSDRAAWVELEKYTKKLVKNIYRTFYQNKIDRQNDNKRNTFSDMDDSSTHYGKQCYVPWTNSFAEISTLLERNAREHQASFVLFTGDIRTDLISSETDWSAMFPGAGYNQAKAIQQDMYDRIRRSKYNFRVLTLDGPDEDDDGMRKRLPSMNADESELYGWVYDSQGKPVVVPDSKIFQGFKFEDLPPTYVIGDTATYDQSYPDRIVNFKTLLDLGEEYPEAEYYLNDTFQRWVRKITQTIMNKQLFPVYTSMETMDVEPHDLTEEQMKDITFQVIPQFYWKYEWSYNEFMIHRVGKLQPHSPDIVMYDMLGNVWEWVRDDWTPSVKSFFNGKVNPIKGTATNDAAVKKVIRGGAFDQLSRKVISPSREGLERNKCQSEYGTQANVGFRPALTFTVEDEGGGFIPGEDPVDLFFLFDASASQDNQIKVMLESAMNIVRKFSGNTSKRDVCHVGSALFLGPTIRFMCCSQQLHNHTKWPGEAADVTQYERVIWRVTSDTKYYGGPEKVKEVEHYVKNTWIDGSSSLYASEIHGIEGAYISENAGCCLIDGKRENGRMYDISKFPNTWIRGGSAEEAAQDFRKLFRNYKNNIWMVTDGVGDTTRDVVGELETPVKTMKSEKQLVPDVEVESEDDVEIEVIDSGEVTNDFIEQKIKGLKRLDGATLMAARDGGGGGGHGGGGGGGGGSGGGSGGGGKWYLNYIVTEYKWTAHKKKMHIYCGVPSWKESDAPDSTIHFGETSKAIGSDSDADYASGITEDNSDGRIYPVDVDGFTSAYKFFTYDQTAEGICDYEYPFVVSNKGVISNWWSGCEPVADMVNKLLNGAEFIGYPYHDGLGYLFRKDIPKLVFVFTNEYDNALNRKYSDTGGTAGTRQVAMGFAAEKGTIKVVTHNSWFGEEYDPPDPYCLQTLRNLNGDFSPVQAFLNKIGLGGFVTAKINDEIDKAKNSFQSLMSSIGAVPELKYEGYPDWNCSWKNQYSINNSQTFQYDIESSDLNKNSKPFGGMKPTQVLTTAQKRWFNTHGQFPYITYEEQKNSSMVCKWVNYKALNTIGYYQLRNTLTQIDDPVNLYLMVSDANAPVKLYETNSASSTEEIANSIFLCNDDRMFQDMDETPLPANIHTIISGFDPPDKFKNNGKWTWRLLRHSNCIYHKNRTLNKLVDGIGSHESNAIRTIFGLDNPYRKTTIVFSKRDGWSTLASKFKGRKGSQVAKEIFDMETVGYTYRDGPTKKDSITTDKEYTYFILGLRAFGDWYDKWMSWGNNPSKKYDTDYSEEQMKGKDAFRRYISDMIRSNVWTNYSTDEDPHPAPADWVRRVHNYAVCGRDDDNNIPQQGKNWIDRHLCQMSQWGSGARRAAGKMCKYNLENDSSQLIGIILAHIRKVDETDPDNHVTTYSGAMSDSYYQAFINILTSAEGFPVTYNQWSDSSYAWTKSPYDYTTITYGRTDPTTGEFEVTGTLKLICKQENFVNSSHATVTGDSILMINGELLKCGVADNPGSGGEAAIFKAILNPPSNVAYPAEWDTAVQRYTHRLEDITSPNAEISNQIWKNATIVNFVNEFYENIKKAMPLMMSYRYHDQMFSQFTNKKGKDVTDYDDKENVVVLKTLPIMDVADMDDMFNTSFAGGQFNAGKMFRYSHCIVDLNPDYTDPAYYGLDSSLGKFPMRFASGVDVNKGAEYKKSKIVLQRIDTISGEKQDTYAMGSKPTDYAEITDPLKLKYKDDESIISASPDDSASVVIGNGGSFQKKRCDLDILASDFKHPGGNDFYWIDTMETQENITGATVPLDKPMKKYFRNKQFFLDPFALTIAQWCYIKGWKTKDAARAGLGFNSANTALSTEKFREIRRSCWKYIYTWEKDEWKTRFDVTARDAVAVDNGVAVPYNEDFEQRLDWMEAYDNTHRNIYNPLDDTRPYYYATYDEIRGTSQIYQAASKGSQYVISASGDEYPLVNFSEGRMGSFVSGCRYDDVLKRYFTVSRGSGSAVASPTILDILNTKVMFKTRYRIYSAPDNTDGGVLLNRAAMFARENAERADLAEKERKSVWCSGEAGGINFDLPTEAQWEYACRVGSTSAFPVAYDLGYNFEERNESLDLIAWYKYKVIGSLPEPERYCSWRISKLLFGIMKDKEQINNVYESDEEAAKTWST